MQVEIKGKKIQEEDVIATVKIKKEGIMVKTEFKDGSARIDWCDSLEEILQTIGAAIYTKCNIPVEKEEKCIK